jgi:hypothetical protein
MIRNAVVGIMSLALLGCVGGWARAEDQGAADIYGRGVHAYNSGDLFKATELLTQLINKQTVDPRVYYFRGLAQSGLGSIDAARADFAKGAELEVNGKQKYDVAAALQRVQGQQRMEIERQRAAARRAAAAKKKKRDQARYEQLRRREDLVLYDPNRPAVDRSELSIPNPVASHPSDPFSSEMVLTGGKAVQVAAPETMETEADPFAAGGEDKPRDPFAADPGKPAEPEDPFSSEDKKKEQAENPFGEQMPADEKAEDPFGESPFGEAMPKAEEDPFADIPDGGAPGALPSGGGGAVGNIFRMLGKTLSEQSSDRNPFEESGDDAGEQTPPAEAPAEDASEQAPADDAPKDTAPKDAEAEDDPFK